ncbi:MAG: glycosyltransferase family 39 protein [Leptolinea sp.]
MRSISNKSLINLLLFLVWMLVILVGYYINHKPMEAGTLSAPVSALFDVLGAFLIMLIIGGIGRIALPAPSLSPLERFGLQAALGVGIMSLFWLLLGELHLYYRWTPFLMLFLLLVYKPSLAWIKELSTLGSVWKQSQLLEKWLGGFSVVLAANQLFLALCPPTRWDALAYHLQLPRLFLEQNSIQIIPSNPYWGQAQVGEMLFTWAVSLYRAETAAVLCWMVGMTFLVGVFGFTSRHTARMISSPAGDPSCPDHSPTAGWMAVAALLSGLTFRSMLSGSYTDIFAAFMGLAVLVALFAWLDSREGTWLVWVGVFIGLAMGVKLTAGILAPAIVVFTLVNRKNNGTPSKFFIWSILLAILFFLPWILKNWSGTGNPLYPYFFPTQWVSALRLSAAIEMSSQTDWLEQLFLPITLTWRGVEMDGLLVPIQALYCCCLRFPGCGSFVNRPKPMRFS